MGLLQFYCLADRKRLVLRPDDGGVDVPYVVPAFVQGDTPSIEFTLLKYNGVRRAPAYVAPGTYSLAAGLYTNDATSTQLAFQSSWTADASTNKYTGTLTFDSGAVSTAIGSAASIKVRLVIKVTISGLDETVYDEEVDLKRRRIPSPATTVPANQTAATVEYVNGYSAPLVGVKSLIWVASDSSGTPVRAFREFYDENGVKQAVEVPLPS